MRGAGAPSPAYVAEEMAQVRMALAGMTAENMPATALTDLEVRKLLDGAGGNTVARKRFGAPVVVVDFGTAVTFDVVDARGNYVGGIIAPGLAMMTNYLHEKAALLPKILCRV